jgi:hypothetical protein
MTIYVLFDRYSDFEGGESDFRGVFDSREAAQAAAPPWRHPEDEIRWSDFWRPGVWERQVLAPFVASLAGPWNDTGIEVHAVTLNTLVADVPA